MKLILSTILLSLTSFAFCQDETADVHTYGGEAFEEGRQIIQTNDGGYCVIGTSGSIQSNTQIVLMKLDEDLECEWSAVYGDLGVDKGVSLCKADGDNYLLCGYGVDPEDGDYNIKLIKVNELGEVIWTRNVGSSDWDFPVKVIEHESGFAVAGSNYGNGNTGSDAIVWFFDEEGILVNTWVWDTGLDEVWRDIDVMVDGSIVTTGGNGTALIIRKWNAEGGEEWTYTKTIAGENLEGIGSDIASDAIYYSGIEEQNDLERAIRGKIDFTGVETFFQEIDLDNDFYFGEPIVYEDAVAFPGMTRNYGAGGADACIFMFNTNNSFIGAPTFGGEMEEFMYSGIVNDIGEIISVGSYTSFSEEIEQLAVIRLSAFYGGDYIKTFDYTGDCISYLTIEEEIKPEPCSGSIEIKYYSLLGELVEFDERNSFGYTGILIKVTTSSNGCQFIEKIFVD